MTLSELCSVTPETQSLKSPNEKQESGAGEERKKKTKTREWREEEQFMISHLSEQRRREKKKKSINFTRGSKSGWVCGDDFIVQSGRLLWRVLAGLDKRAASAPVTP